MDEHYRKVERLARSGDLVAREELFALDARLGNILHGDVVLFDARTHLVYNLWDPDGLIIRIAPEHPTPGEVRNCSTQSYRYPGGFDVSRMSVQLVKRPMQWLVVCGRPPRGRLWADGSSRKVTAIFNDFRKAVEWREWLRGHTFRLMGWAPKAHLESV